MWMCIRGTESFAPDYSGPYIFTGVEGAENVVRVGMDSPPYI